MKTILIEQATMDIHTNLLGAIILGIVKYHELKIEDPALQNLKLAYMIRKEVTKFLEAKFRECVDEEEKVNELTFFKLWDCIMQ